MSMATFSTTYSLSMVSTWLWLFIGLLMAITGTTDGNSMGVCYGMLGNNLPSPKEVVELYKSKKIERMRLYYPQQDAFDALRGSNIQVILDVPREALEMLSNSESAANDWFQSNVRSYHPDVKFQYITVGNEVIPDSSGDYSYAKYVFPAMHNIHKAILAAGLQDQIKVSTAVLTGVLGTSYPPSQGSFSGEASGYMAPIVDFLGKTQAPLLANVYPYFSYVLNSNINLQYALFTSPTAQVADGQIMYHNLFDAIVDAHYAALEKVGGSGVEIVVSESGWPSEGGKDATKENAQTYNSNLINHVAQGTPKRPGKPIETYLFAMFNENQKHGNEVERNFGLFYPSKEPVYQINFA